VLDLGDGIDSVTFEQILEMDDDDEREFSKSIVFGFFEQAEQTFKKMDDALYVFSPLPLYTPLLPPQN
jgi:osomolarity two-component system phosphorelay intermediate protein YPD1